VIVYSMHRGGSVVAEVVTLDSGQCVVSWPACVVYDSEEAAREVHITLMGGRGEETRFRPVWSDRPDFMRGVENAWLDDLENGPWQILGGSHDPAADLRVPDWDSLTDRRAFADGYLAMAEFLRFPRRERMDVMLGVGALREGGES